LNTLQETSFESKIARGQLALIDAAHPVQSIARFADRKTVAHPMDSLYQVTLFCFQESPEGVDLSCGHGVLLVTSILDFGGSMNPSRKQVIREENSVYALHG
jgi:hypothetical protein